MTKILIIGGVANGASTATKARRINEDAEIVIFEQDPSAVHAFENQLTRFNIDIRMK